MDPGPLPEELPRVTARHLRRTASLCPSRLAKEVAGKRGQRSRGLGFEVANRIVAAARQAHSEMRVATGAGFSREPHWPQASVRSGSRSTAPTGAPSCALSPCHGTRDPLITSVAPSL